MAKVFRNFPGVQASPPFPSMCLVKHTIQEECLSCKISSPPHSHLPSLCPPGHSAHPAYILSPNDPGGPVFPQGVLRFFCKQIVFFHFYCQKGLVLVKYFIWPSYRPLERPRTEIRTLGGQPSIFYQSFLTFSDFSAHLDFLSPLFICPPCL